MLQWFIRARADYLVIIRITTGHFWRHFYEHINLAMTLRNANRVIGEKEPKGNHATWKSHCVDAKSALNAKHTASRTKLASHAQREKDVPVNFS
jgi:hypothetical protein